jgi:peptidoglycan/xylan/chitin deacetylase (PgdA/CDA1 family)
MKYRKLIYLISLFLFVIIITIYFLIQKNKISENFLVKSDNNIQKIEEVKQLPQAPIEQYLISKDFNIIPKDKNGNKKIVLLTIDDGPSRQSLAMLKILQAHNTKAIFFINGMHDKNNLGVIEEESKNGYPIGNHTWSHLNLKRSKNIDLINKEINNNTELITKKTLVAPKFFRPPYGESNKYVKDLIKNNNMIFIDWSTSAKDWEKTSKEKSVFIKNVTDNLHNGSIILIHEHPWSLANLDELLTTIEKKGYTFADPNNITN